ncbi:Uu.00g039410.m01.CDS01 [Anthostomella pinea]|uniref:Uu.00g039410.m01.CDS01 n=1 Tax=Anthostomella pinea TaxID=933095 RepID=A0AAI8VA40_9PEZI|nr:Uu.00g039410.m01.CDS01 [Anthostomella pinea]
MASQQNLKANLDGAGRSTPTLRQKGWAPIKNHQPYPPPRDIKNYAARALPDVPGDSRHGAVRNQSGLPPRPNSSSSYSSSIYDSEGDDGAALRKQNPKQELPIRQQPGDARASTSFSGAMDEAAFDMIRQPPPLAINPPKSRDQPEIASPQPRIPALSKAHQWIAHSEDRVSPVTPGSGRYPYVGFPVSPISEHGVSISFEETTSEPDHHPYKAYNPSVTPSSNWSHSTSQASKSPQPPPETSLHPHVQKINLRYSDPGSPISVGPGGDVRGFGGPGPDIGSSFRSHQSAQGQGKGNTSLSVQSAWGKQADGDRPASPASGRKVVSFAVPQIDSFSSGSGRRQSSPWNAAPPPLELSERPVAQDHEKTPFPPQTDASDSQRSFFDDSDDNNDDEVDDRAQKTHKRVSSFTAMGLGKSLRPGSSSHKNVVAPVPEARHVDVQVRLSPVPKPKKHRNILSRAKHGLGLSSEDAKRERKRDEIKRQIRFGNSGE